MFSRMRVCFNCFAITITMLLFSACTEEPASPDSSDQPMLFICESDFMSGLLERAPASGTTPPTQVLSIYQDAVLRTFGGFLYILERYGADNIIKFDPAKTGQSGVVYHVHLGNNWNPHDIEFVSETKAYISHNNEPKITVFNPSSGVVISHIDISSYTFNPDSNTSPNAADLHVVGNYLYVMLQRCDGFKPGGATLLLKVNTSTDAIVDTIALQYKNGFAMAYADGALYVTNPGSVFSTGDGAVERVDLSTKMVTTVIDETALGGNPNHIVHKDGNRFYVTNYIGWKNISVVELDATTGTVIATIPGVKDAYGGIYYDQIAAKLYVGERDSIEMGVRVFENNSQVGATLKSSSSLPPTGMVVIRR